MQMHQVRYFVSVCELRNFTRAAERCHVTQPALTRAIGGLEAELGGELFHRRHAGSSLTAFGEFIRPYLEEIASQARAVRVAAERWRRSTDGVLRVGVAHDVGAGFLGRFLAQFARSHPTIQLDLIAESIH